MEKTLEFLEKHVQWLAIGLGGLFLAWALYAYLLVSPVAVGPFTPGDVDDHVRKTQREPLELSLKQDGPVQAPQQAEQTVIATFRKNLAAAEDQPDLAVNWVNSKPSDFQIGPDQKGPDSKAMLVENLPEVPPSDPLEIKAARAYIGPAPLAAGAVPPPAPAPVAPLAPGAPPALPPGYDTSYVRISYRIPSDEIAKAFEKEKVPTNTTTGVVAVKLMRQEQRPDGSWTDAMEVPYLKNNVTIYPLPPAGAAMPEVNAFRAWSDSPQGQGDLLRPLFYPVVFGEGPWDPPADEALPKWDPEAIRLEKARIAKEQQDARRRAAPTPTPRGPRGRGGPPGGGEPEFDAPDPQRPASLGGLIRVQYPRPGMPGMPPMPGGEFPTDDFGGGQPGMPQQQLAPGQVPPPAEPLPSPSFQPAVTQPFLCWAYDETVVEGHTYRYQVLYALRNPVYESNIVKAPEMSKQFALWSKLVDDATAWTQPVEVKPTAEFYLAGTNWSAGRTPNSLKIDVYKWAQGKWQTLPFTVAPGDTIGDTQNGIDFGTDVTVVDLMYDPRGNGGAGRPYVLLLTADGRLVEREPTADRNNIRMNQLKQVIQMNAPAPGQPGGPPIPGQPPVAAGPRM